MTSNLLWIALGGAVGALLRLGISVSTIRITSEHFPYGTLLVNIVGSLAIGILWAFHEKEPFSEGTGAFVFVGILGAFTTFSTYSLDTMRMIQEGRHFAGGMNIVANNAGAILGVLLGYMLGRFLRGGT
jgi:fluoride exporter